MSTQESSQAATEAPQPDNTALDSAEPTIPVAKGPLKTPYNEPLPEARPTPAAELTPEQSKKHEILLETVSKWETVPATSAKNAPLEPITDDERMWLTRECLLRYMRAVKWDINEAPKRLLGTLTWRREYGISNHTPEYISPENETGKQVILGFDKNARPCLYLCPSKQNTSHSDRQLQHLFFMIERTIDLMGPGQETLSLLINFKDSKSGQNATVGQGRQTLAILQNHYPERLGRALVINIPWFMTAFFKLISPFIDPLTREKLKFNEDLRDHVPPAQLWNSMGGDIDFEYDHAVYWPALIGLANERKTAYQKRWIEAGKRVGEREGYLRGGDEKSVAESDLKSATAEVPPPLDEKAATEELNKDGSKAGVEAPVVAPAVESN